PFHRRLGNAGEGLVAEEQQIAPVVVAVDDDDVAGVDLVGCHQRGERLDEKPFDAAFEMARAVSIVSAGREQGGSGRLGKIEPEIGAETIGKPPLYGANL